MSRRLYLGSLIFGLFLFGLVTLRGEALTLAIPVVCYLLFGFAKSQSELRLEAVRHLSADRVAPGAPVTVTLTVWNRGTGLEEVLLEDSLPAGLKILDGAPSSLVTLPAGGSHTWTYTVTGGRGRYGFNSVRARAGDHLAVAAQQIDVEAKGFFFIFPPLARLRNVSIHPRRTRVYAGMGPARAGGAGIEFFGVRAFQTGDSPRRINWRASARHAELFTNEFQQHRVADVGIVLDSRLRTNAFGRGLSLFEHSVQAAASLADVLLSQGDRVGLLLYGNVLDWTLPGYGKVQRERILYALANAQLGDSMIFGELEYIPARLFPPESQLVMVSPLTTDDFKPLVGLRALGYQVLVVSPDPVAFEASQLGADPAVKLAARVVRLERQLLLRRLQRAGVQVLDWRVSEPFDQAVRQRLGRVPALLHALAART